MEKENMAEHKFEYLVEEPYEKKRAIHAFTSAVHYLLDFMSPAEIQQLLNDEIGSGDKPEF